MNGKKRLGVLVANEMSAANLDSNIQVNVTTRVNNQSIRRETHNGKEHWVLPSYTLPANVVMNDGLYTAEQIDRHYEGIEGTLAPLGHPTVNGEFVSAFSPEGINQGHIGAWNRNVKKAGNRVYVEKWVDVEVARQSEKGKELLERVEAIERGEDVPPIHTSICVFLDQLEPDAEQAKTGAKWVANIHSVDHDAILLHEVGAATPEQGVGLMVNADKATLIKPTANSGALVGESMRELEQRLDKAARKKFAPGENEYAWIADFTLSQAIVVTNGGDAKVYGYKSEGGKIVFDDNGTSVERSESWVTVATNKLIDFFVKNEQTKVNEQEGDMPLTEDELKKIGEMISNSTKEAVEPINQKLEKLEANTDEQFKKLTANHDAEETRKRDAVKAVHGEIIANALQGEALDEMFKKLGTAAPIAPNSATSQPQTGAPKADEYFN